MRLIGILSWYEEPAPWLAATITSMIHHTQIDHLVAVDGAYGLLPAGRGFSGEEQHRTILETCRAAEVGVTLHIPQEPWIGNEVEKRSFAFSLAEKQAEVGEDWYFIMDADDVVLNAMGVKAALAETELDVAECSLVERNNMTGSPGAELAAQKIDIPLETTMPIRKLFRALPRLHVAENHFTFLSGNGRVLWCGGPGGMVEATQVRMEIEHRTQFRSKARRSQQLEYYRRRDELGIESTYVPTDLPEPAPA